MSGEIELIGDSDGVLVTGDKVAVERFLADAGLLDRAERFDLSRLTTVLRAGSDLATTSSGMIEQSGMYLKLTSDSAKRLKRSGGLMKTKTKGVSHVMLGKAGDKSLKWLQAEDGPRSLLTNPAILSGVGGLLSQFAQQSEAQELKALLVRIDDKLDDVRRAQRDAILARMSSSASAIDEAAIIRAQGGDPRTLWDKVSGASASILRVQEESILALVAAAEKAEGLSRPGQVKKAMRVIEAEVQIHLAVLARCFELQDEFGVVELDHVLSTAPEHLDGHRLGITAAREERYASVMEVVDTLTSRLDSAGAYVNANVLLHARTARAVIDSVNSTAALLDDFRGPLGVESSRRPLELVAWRDAARDSGQRRTASREAGQKALAVGGPVVALALAARATKSAGDSSS